MSQKRYITAEDLYQLELITAVQLSPSGKQVAFSLQSINAENEKKHNHLWLVDTDGQTPPRQITFGPHSNRAPQWSPSGQHLAFLSDRSGSSQLYLLPLNGGEARPLTDFNGALDLIQWTPDGQQLLLRLRKKDEDLQLTPPQSDDDPPQSPNTGVITQLAKTKELGVRARHIHLSDYKNDGTGYMTAACWQLALVDAQDGAITWLTDGTFDARGPHIAPDGEQIVFWGNRQPDTGLAWAKMEMFTVSRTGENFTALDLPPGPKSHPRYSPDGRWLAYLTQGGQSDRWQPNHLWLIPSDFSQPPRNLTAHLDRFIGNATLGDCDTNITNPPLWSADSQQLYVQVTRHGTTTLHQLNIADDPVELTPVISGDVTINAISIDSAGHSLAYLQASMREPAQVWTHHLPSGESRQLTQVNQALFAELMLGEVEEVWFNSEDDYKVQGWVITPPEFDPSQQYPSIMEIHGGPMAQYGHAFMHEFQYLAAQGYVVYFCNPRGGFGYGADHAKAIYDAWGTVDYVDLVAWNDWIQQKPYIDPARMGVTGGSYGGYMTNWLIARTDRFKAAVTQRCVSNMISMIGSSDLGMRFLALFGGTTFPWDNLEHYWKLSPISEMNKATTPTLVLHSENDMRCEIEQGEQVFMALKYVGTPTELVRIPAESHGLSRSGRTDRRLTRLSHILRWFDTYLV